MSALEHHSAETIRPDTLDALRETIAEAAAAEVPLAIEGHGSKQGLGRPVQAARTLSTASLAGIQFFEPEELVLSAMAGTPIVELEALLASRGQRFEFEPMDYGPLHGLPAGKGTLGGVLACNLSGPRRIKQGAARDHVLGVTAVSGRGEIFKSGGRVVKNVTGYDLSKGLAGSYGTLAVMAEIIVKTLPRCESEETLLVRDLADDAAAGVMAAAMGSSAEVSGAAHLPYGVASRVLGGHLGKAPATAIRLEGFRVSVDARAAYLARALGRAGPLERLGADESAALWRDVRDVIPFADGTERRVWRVSLPPTYGHAFVMALRMQVAADAFYDWQGGLVWLRMDHEAEADIVRQTLRRYGGGHATLVRAPLAERLAVPVFEPQPPELRALSQRLKKQFDPKDVLNPGRMG